MNKSIKGVTSDKDLISLSNTLGINIDEILTINEIIGPLDKSKTYLILLRSDQDVGHWTCANDGFYFHPQGVGPPTKLGIIKYNDKQYQGTYEYYCGIWCLLWLYSVQHNRPDLMYGFHDLNNRDFENFHKIFETNWIDII
ncbi:hypothetical protein THRCLA_22818, partial [Thraustotheca clavata]